MSALFRKLLLLVLGIPFVMIGTRFLLDAAESAYTYQASADWKTGKATLDSVERFSSGDQAFGNQTLVRYQYEMDGQIFSGQFSCDECPQENLYETLRMSKEQNNSVAVLIIRRRHRIPALSQLGSSDAFSEDWRRFVLFSDRKRRCDFRRVSAARQPEST